MAQKNELAKAAKATKADEPNNPPRSGPRRFSPASFRNRRQRRKAAKQVARTKLPSAFGILRSSVRKLASHWEIFGGLLLVYMFVNIILVGGIANASEFSAIKQELTELFTGQFKSLSTGLTLFAFLVTSGSTTASGAASAYQVLLLVVISLAIIYALRQLYAGSDIRIRDALYNSTYPLVQLLLVLLMVGLHLAPAITGSFLFNVLVMGGIFTALWLQVLVTVISLAMVVWSAYLLCASLMAMYIVTLPGMTPLKALRSAKEIVRYRRGAVLRKLLFLPLVLLVVSAVVMMPLAIWLTPVAPFIFFILTMVGVPVVHSYMYALYRELIAT